jgi:hypothetical protein
MTNDHHGENFGHVRGLADFFSLYRMNGTPGSHSHLISRVPEERLKTCVLVTLGLRFSVRGILKSRKSYKILTKAPSSAPNLKPEPHLRNPAPKPRYMEKRAFRGTA